MENLSPKVAIIGGGNVGIRYAYALMMSGVARQILIIDPDKKRIEGEALDLSHGAPFISPVEITAGSYPDLAGSDLVVITAGKRQKPGQSRLELVRTNVELYRSIIPEVVKYAPRAILLIVSNPVDILTYAAFKFSGKPSKEVIGSGTVLDSARFRYELARHCRIDPRNVHAYILGEHGDTEFPVWSKVMIGGVFMDKFCPFCDHHADCSIDEKRHEIFVSVRDSAYKIIELKGETSYGIGLALVRITQAILNNENAVLPVSSLVQNYLGVNNIYLSMPAIVNREGIREVLRLDLDTGEERLFKHSAEVVGDIIKDVLSS